MIKDPFDKPFDRSHPLAMARTAVRLNPNLSQAEKDRVIMTMSDDRNSPPLDVTPTQLNKIPPDLFEKLVNDIASKSINPTQEDKTEALNALRNSYVGLGHDVLEAARKIGLGEQAIQWHKDLVALHGNREAQKRKVKEIRGAIHRKVRELDQEARQLGAQKARMGRSRVAIEEINAWLKRGDLALQRPERSTYLKLRESFLTDEVYVTSAPDVAGPDLLKYFDECWEEVGAQLFVIEHDWARAFEKAEGFDLGPFKLPHEYCIFEFRIGGRQIIATCFMNETDGDVMMFTPVTRTSVGWFAHGSCCLMPDGRLGAWHGQNPISKAGEVGTANGITFEVPSELKKNPNAFVQLDERDKMFPVYRMIAKQIRAVSIALAAEVAQTDVVRVPHKSNQPPRAGRQAPTGFSYHVVSLARRHRAAPVPADLASGEKRTSPRLHFRRQHTRHYRNYNVEIAWQLVGDPELGWIEKHYKL